MSEPEQRAVEGFAHLQGAAVQLIAAARAFLDVAEDLVTDPAAAGAVVHTLGALAGLARAGWDHSPADPPDHQAEARRHGPTASDHAPHGGGGGRITRIPLADEGSAPA